MKKRKEYLTEDERWVTFYPKFSAGFYVEKAGYFDERPQVHTSVTQLLALALLPVLISTISLWFLVLAPLLLFGWGKLFINLPIRTGIQDCDSAAWGLNYHGNMLWVYTGGGGNFEGGKTWKTITMPWNLVWVRTSTLMKDDTWFVETDKKRKSWKEDPEGIIEGTHNWLEKNKKVWVGPYTDNFDGSIVNATISVKEMEWRPIAFKWTSLFAKKRKSVDIDFDAEVGSRKGSYKGGVIGCSETIIGDETPLETLRRMERNRNF